MPVSAGKVKVTAVLLCALFQTLAAKVLPALAVQNAAFVQPELAKVMVTDVAALRPVISPPALVEWDATVPAEAVGAVITPPFQDKLPDPSFVSAPVPCVPGRKIL